MNGEGNRLLIDNNLEITIFMVHMGFIGMAVSVAGLICREKKSADKGCTVVPVGEHENSGSPTGTTGWQKRMAREALSSLLPMTVRYRFW